MCGTSLFSGIIPIRITQLKKLI